MAAVFPWSRESPVVALALVLGFALYLILISWGHQGARRLLLGREDETPRLARVMPDTTRRTLARTISWGVGVLTTYLVVYATTWVWQPFDEVAFTPLMQHLPAVLTLFGIFVGANLLLDGVHRLVQYLGGSATRKPVRAMNAQVLGVLERFFRLVIFITSGITTSVVVLDTLGYSAGAGEAILAWFRDQAGSLFLLGALIGVGWAGAHISRAIIGEMRYTSRRFSPQVIDAMGSVVRGALFTVLGLVGLITLLNAVGQGAVGGTLVVVLSSFIGLTVAMAGTGSIGNALSGAVIVSFRPYDKGERIIVHDNIMADVEEVSLMFTKVRTPERTLIEIPNNQILAKPIINLSRSGPHAIKVKLGIGYDVSHSLVRKLAIEAALATEEILKDPAPQLFARNLGSYAIEYELFAFTRNPRHLEPRSELLGNLQDRFYGAGVEIMTPDIYVLRKGKTAEPEGFVRVAVDAPRRVPEEPREEPAASKE